MSIKESITLMIFVDVKMIIIMIVKALVILFLLFGILLSPVIGQQKKNVIVVYPNKKSLCLGYKVGQKNYFIEDGEIFYQGKKIVKTQKGCFYPPQRLCSIGKQVNLVFYPYQLYGYFKKTIPFSLTGKKVLSKKGNKLKKVVYCFPFGQSQYYGDETTIKINDYKELQRLYSAIPYVKNVEIKDSQLYQTIKPYVKKCAQNDITCLVYNVYSSVTKNLTYKSDTYTGNQDYIRTPHQTIKDKGGDCEDLTGVLVSFLANLKVDSYVLMTSKHAYAMACDVVPEYLQKYIRKSMERTISHSEKKVLKYGDMKAFYYSLYRGGKGLKKWDFYASGDYPFNFLVVPGRIGRGQIQKKNFNYRKECSGINVTEFSSSCKLESSVTLITTYGLPFPKTKSPTRLSKQKINKIKFTIRNDYNLADLNQISVHYYKLKKNGRDTYCVVLEPTAGAEGYPGFSQVKNQLSIAVSPVNWKWFYLKNSQSF